MDTTFRTPKDVKKNLQYRNTRRSDRLLHGPIADLGKWSSTWHRDEDLRLASQSASSGPSAKAIKKRKRANIIGAAPTPESTISAKQRTIALYPTLGLDKLGRNRRERWQVDWLLGSFLCPGPYGVRRAMLRRFQISVADRGYNLHVCFSFGGTSTRGLSSNFIDPCGLWFDPLSLCKTLRKDQGCRACWNFNREQSYIRVLESV